jgi:hypothetical protein
MRPDDVRFGSKADFCVAESHVRFTPESGHFDRTHECPPCANNCHCPRLRPAALRMEMWLVLRKSPRMQVAGLSFGRTHS